ncbi:unnamed protein product [Citrullus colocynthis]|uniref:Germin-like protein n=1 Tax=Citrullus colocynthis TaxID=252529 RepID=A0ABP0YL84_9ROSI
MALAPDLRPFQHFFIADPNSNGLLLQWVACGQRHQHNHWLSSNSGDRGANLRAQHSWHLLGSHPLRPRGHHCSLQYRHPHATEISTVLEGKLLAGFIANNLENRLITKTLNKGNVFVFPKGLINFQRNIGHHGAVAIATLNSQNPGVIPLLINAVFGSKHVIPKDILVH